MKKIAVVTAGMNDQSSTTSLATQAAEAIQEAAGDLGADYDFELITLRSLSDQIGQAVATGRPSAELRKTLDGLREADGVVMATPVYKASYAGLFKSFVDLLDDDALLGTPMLLLATAGTPRHALVPDDLMRPLFAYMRALPIPTSVFAATEDWAEPAALRTRMERAAQELVTLVQAGTMDKIRRQGKGRYRTTFVASGGTEDEDVAAQVDFDTELMRLAAGGK